MSTTDAVRTDGDGIEFDARRRDASGRVLADDTRAEVRIRPRNVRASDAMVMAASFLAGFSLAWVLFFLTPLDGAVGYVFVSILATMVIFGVVVNQLEGWEMAKDRVAMVLVGTMAMALMLPLVVIVIYVIIKGWAALHPGSFTQDANGVRPSDPPRTGGLVHAILGSMIQVGIAMMISVPLGVTCAIYLNEVRGRMARPVRTFVDAMSGLPSIVAGLFIFGIWVSAGTPQADGTVSGGFGFNFGFSGFAASLALAMLMLPTVTRASEVVLRLVPGGLREASLALGAPEWRTTWQVVLPTARAGIITAVILGVARAVGETAPLIMTSFGGTNLVNLNPFNGPMASLPKYIFENFRSSENNQVARAWTGALVLIILVLALFSLARVLGRRTPGARRPSKPSRRATKETSA